MAAGVVRVRLRSLDRREGEHMQWVALGLLVVAVVFFVLTALARLLERPGLAPWVRIGKPVDRWRHQ
jgi:hypothetical protein